MVHDCPRIKPTAILHAMQSMPLYDGVFILGCFERRVTVRSQQVRALNLMYALRECGRLRPGQRVAVIGGGIAGVTAAAAAARLGAKQVVLLEKAGSLLHLQEGCDHRWLHPHIYDWPEGGSTDRRAGLPLLDWETATAGDVARQIQAAFATLPERSRIEVWYQVSSLEPPNERRLAWLGCRETPGGMDAESSMPDEPFDVIVYAVGFGAETIPDGLGPAASYWRSDAHEQPVLGGAHGRYLVSGCGDGGLIDLLRLRIQNFDHADLFKTYVEAPCEANELALLSEQLLEVEARARILAGDKSGFLRDEYKKLSVPPLVDEVLLKLRVDTVAHLNGQSESPLSLGSSILNRFLTSRLLYFSKAPPFYRRGLLSGVRRVNGHFECQIGNNPPSSYDQIIVRHGPHGAIADALGKQSETVDLRRRAFADLDITRDRLWPQDYFDSAGLRTSFDVRGIRAEEAPQIKARVRSGPLSEVTDDALYLKFSPYAATRIPVRLAAPTYDALLDELNGVAYDEVMHRSRSGRWMESYKTLASVQKYLEQNLQHEARFGKVDRHDCKIGFAELDGSSFGNNMGTPPLVVRPLNHLVSYLFNRSFAVARINRLESAERMWRDCLEQFAQGPTFRMPCPSQLFIELVLLTRDGDVPIGAKAMEGSVYTLRNGGQPVKTCGPERGSRWQGTIVSDEAGNTYYDIRSSIAAALGDEYRIALPGKSVKGAGPVLQLAQEPYFEVNALAVQCFHLNSALLGTCVLPVGSEELKRHLAEVSSAGGLLFGHEPMLLSLDDVEAVVERGRDTTEWHGTALARLELAYSRRDALSQIAATFRDADLGPTSQTADAVAQSADARLDELREGYERYLISRGLPIGMPKPSKRNLGDSSMDFELENRSGGRVVGFRIFESISTLTPAVLEQLTLNPSGLLRVNLLTRSNAGLETLAGTLPAHVRVRPQSEMEDAFRETCDELAEPLKIPPPLAL